MRGVPSSFACIVLSFSDLTTLLSFVLECKESLEHRVLTWMLTNVDMNSDGSCTWPRCNPSHGRQEVHLGDLTTRTYNKIQNTLALHRSTRAWRLERNIYCNRLALASYYANSVEILARNRAANLAARLQLAKATADNLEFFTQAFIGNDELSALVNQRMPEGATHAHDVLIPAHYKKWHLEGPHSLFHCSDVPPDELSNDLHLPDGTLYPAEELTHLQPWDNRPSPYKYSDQNSVFARVTLNDTLRFVTTHYRWIQGTHYVYYFLPNNPHHNLFKQLYLNGNLPGAGMNGDVAQFCCAPAHVTPSGCIQVERDQTGKVVSTLLLDLSP